MLLQGRIKKFPECNIEIAALPVKESGVECVLPMEQVASG
jgi:hypothetical protein